MLIQQHDTYIQKHANKRYRPLVPRTHHIYVHILLGASSESTNISTLHEERRNARVTPMYHKMLATFEGRPNRENSQPKEVPTYSTRQQKHTDGQYIPSINARPATDLVGDVHHPLQARANRCSNLPVPVLHLRYVGCRTDIRQ